MQTSPHSPSPSPFDVKPQTYDDEFEYVSAILCNGLYGFVGDFETRANVQLFKVGERANDVPNRLIRDAITVEQVHTPNRALACRNNVVVGMGMGTMMVMVMVMVMANQIVILMSKMMAGREIQMEMDHLDGDGKSESLCLSTQKLQVKNMNMSVCVCVCVCSYLVWVVGVATKTYHQYDGNMPRKASLSSCILE